MSSDWKIYRTRFLVNAKQLHSPLSFIDHLGRQHCGRKGDYLVESCDGVLSIAPRQIFEDIYVAMMQPQDGAASPGSDFDSPRASSLNLHRAEPLEVEFMASEKPYRRRRTDRDDPARPRRKAPQAVRNHRDSEQVHWV